MTKSIFSTEQVKVQLTTLSTTKSMPFYLAITAGSAIAIAGLLTWFTMKKSSEPKTKEKYELYFTRFIVVTVIAEVGAYFVVKWIIRHSYLFAAGIATLAWLFQEVKSSSTMTGVSQGVKDFTPLLMVVGTLWLGYKYVRSAMKPTIEEKKDQELVPMIAQHKVEASRETETQVTRLEVEIGNLKRQVELLTSNAMIGSVRRIADTSEEPITKKVSKKAKRQCEHCGEMVPEDHICWVIEKKVACFKCKQPNHIAMMCKNAPVGGITLTMKNKIDKTSIQAELERLSKLLNKVEESNKGIRNHPSKRTTTLAEETNKGIRSQRKRIAPVEESDSSDDSDTMDDGSIRRRIPPLMKVEPEDLTSGQIFAIQRLISQSQKKDF